MFGLIKDLMWPKQGSFTTEEGDRYTGGLDIDTPIGFGEMHYADGIIYKGEFKHGKKNGKGKMTWPDGSVYLGSFKTDKFHGKGKLIQADGLTFIGGFFKDKLDGEGTIIFDDSSRYDGQFKKDKMHGQGRLTAKLEVEDGTINYICKGGFQDNALNGQGYMLATNKETGEWEKYFGEYKDGLPHGTGAEFHSDGEQRLGVWANGEYIGEWGTKIPVKTKKKARKEKKDPKPISQSQSVDDGKIRDLQEYKIMIASIFNK